MSTRQFVDIIDPDDPRLPGLAYHWSGLTDADMGRELARFRGWPAWRMNLGALVVIAVGSALAAVSPVGDRRGLVLTWIIIVAVLYLVFFLLINGLDKHRVHEHGLVLGYRRRSRLVVPWESIDPGRVHAVDRAWALYRQRAVTSTDRGAFLALRALVVNGLNTASFDPMFTNWVIGMPRPERLAAAIEAAMVADGYPATGLAEHARHTAITLRWRPVSPAFDERKPLDPLMGLPPA